MSTDRWSPVVFGRVHQLDVWERAVPGGVVDGWLRDAINVVMDSAGNGLEYGPRYVLSRRDGRVFVGVACMATELSTTMVVDNYGRPLYACVGWAADNPHGVPGLSELAEHGTAWAAPLYKLWVGRDWESNNSQDCLHTTEAAPAPWDGAVQPDERPDFPDVPDGHVLLVPEGRLAEAWAALAADPGRDATIAGSWRRCTALSRQQKIGADVIGVAEIRTPWAEPLPAPSVPPETPPSAEPEPAAQPVPAPRPGLDLISQVVGCIVDRFDRVIRWSFERVPPWARSAPGEEPVQVKTPVGPRESGREGTPDPAGSAARVVPREEGRSIEEFRPPSTRMGDD